MANWAERKDQKSGRSFWFNSVTGESSWTSPSSSTILQSSSAWEVMSDPATGRQFFYNKANGSTQWERPADLNENSAQQTLREKELSGATKDPAELADADAAPRSAWKEMTDVASGRIYFYNTQSGVSVWEKPSELVESEGGSSNAASNGEWTRRRARSEVLQAVGDWEELKDPETQRVFFYSRRTGESQWERPAEMSPIVQPTIQSSRSSDGDESAHSQPSEAMRHRSIRLSFDLRTDWEELKDPQTNRVFFFNRRTGESRWERPEGLGLVAQLAYAVAGDGASSTSAATTAAANSDNKEKSEWERIFDKSTNRPFYYNATNGTSQWIKPDGFVVNDDENIQEEEQKEEDGADWVQIDDSSSGKSYWYNKTTGESSWGRLSRSRTTQKKKVWRLIPDEDSGRSYYYNSHTGESLWTRPEDYDGDEDDDDLEELKPAKIKAENATTATKSATLAVWTMIPDSNSGKYYFYNTTTGESSWSRPDSYDGPEPNEQQQVKTEQVTTWRIVSDESSGRSFFYNSVTGVSSWTRPADFDGDEELEPATSVKTAAAAVSRWQMRTDLTTSRQFWYNPTTRESSWTNPSDVNSSTNSSNTEAYWQEMTDPTTSRQFWYNVKTGQSSLTNPTLANDAKIATTNIVENRPIEIISLDEKEPEAKTTMAVRESSAGAELVSEDASENEDVTEGEELDSFPSVDEPILVSRTTELKRLSVTNIGVGTDSMSNSPKRLPDSSDDLAPPQVIPVVTKRRGYRASVFAPRSPGVGGGVDTTEFGSSIRGFLKKRGERLGRKIWQSRWFVADNHYLKYYKTAPKGEETAEGLLATIDMRQVALVTKTPGSMTDFVLVGQEGTGVIATLRAPTSQLRTAWVAGLIRRAGAPNKRRSSPGGINFEKAVTARSLSAIAAAAKAKKYNKNATPNSGTKASDGVVSLAMPYTTAVPLSGRFVLKPGCNAVCTRSYVAVQEGELSFARGDVIEVLTCSEDERWWTGRLNNREGRFLPSCVKLERGDSSDAPLLTAGNLSPGGLAARQQIMQMSRRVQQRQRGGQLRQLLEQFGLGEITSLGQYPNSETLSKMRDAVLAANLHNHELKVETKGGDSSPPQDTLDLYGRLLKSLQRAPALLASIGTSLKLEAQYILAATLCHSLFDGCSAKENLLLSVIEAAVEEQDAPRDGEELYEDETRPNGQTPFLPPLLAAYAQRNECRNYLDHAIRPIRREIIRLLRGIDSTDWESSRRNWESIGSPESAQAVTRYDNGPFDSTMSDPALHIAGLILEKLSTTPFPPGLAAVAKILANSGGDTAARQFFVDVIVLPVVTSPRYFGTKPDRPMKSSETRAQRGNISVSIRRLELVSHAIRAAAIPPIATKLPLRMQAALAPLQAGMNRLLNGAVAMVPTLLNDVGESKPPELCGLVVMSCFELFMLHLAIDVYQAQQQPSASLALPADVHNALSALGPPKPIYGSDGVPSQEGRNPYVLLKLQGTRDQLGGLDEATCTRQQQAAAAEVGLNETARRLLENARIKLQQYNDQIECGGAAWVEPREESNEADTELLATLRQFEPIIQKSLREKKNLSNALRLAEQYRAEMLMLRDRLETKSEKLSNRTNELHHGSKRKRFKDPQSPDHALRVAVQYNATHASPLATLLSTVFSPMKLDDVQNPKEEPSPAFSAMCSTLPPPPPSVLPPPPPKKGAELLAEVNKNTSRRCNLKNGSTDQRLNVQLLGNGNDTSTRRGTYYGTYTTDEALTLRGLHRTNSTFAR